MESLTVSQASKVSGLSAATLKRRIQAGELKSSTDRNGWNIIEHSDLMNFLAIGKLSKTREGASAQRSLKKNVLGDQTHLITVLETALSDAKDRIKSLEVKLDNAERENRKYEAEMRAILSGGVMNTVSRWIKTKQR